MNAPNDFDVAIIGMAGRFPGAGNIGAFWENLHAGKESISFFPDQELEVYIDPAQLRNPNFVRAGGLLENVELFDAAFFNISAREAEWMDPQQRIFLECAWEAIEHAGYDPLASPGRVAVYAGVNTNSYLLSRLSQLPDADPASFFRMLLSNEKDHLATRVSYKLNLRGESITVQTSCSTSLVAVHLAYQSLIGGQCSMALAGGVSIRVPQKTGYLYQDGMVVSPDGHCRPFDAKAMGTVPGNGCGVVVLKRASDAVKDRDTIYAVIKSSAINNDGNDKVGYTAPSVQGQADVINRALTMSGVRAEEIGYVEAHGTGTQMGDPIEVEALNRVYRKRTQKKQYCILGAVKSMIGHLDNAAGVAGLVKTALAFHHAEIPPTLHFEAPNPMLNLAESPFRVTSKEVEWKPGTTPRYAGLSSFGIGGTNVHMILGEAPVAPPAEDSLRPQLLTISARSADAVRAAATQLADAIDRDPNSSMADAAYTQNTGRHAFEHRAFAVGGTREQITSRLRQASARPTPAEGSPKLAYLFAGQGVAKPGMARSLYEAEPEFRRHVDSGFAFAQQALGINLRERLYGPDAGWTELSVGLPALFLVEYALAQVWLSWGIQPAALCGHSFGEFVAACVAGSFTLEEGLRIAAMRGRLMQKLPPGAMTAVRAASDEIGSSLSGGAVVSAINSLTDCTISGSLADIQAAEARLRERSIAFVRLDVPYAYHSSDLDFILDEYGEIMSGLHCKAPDLPLVSTLTGEWLQPEQATSPRYWVDQLRQPVQFAAAVQTLQKSATGTYLEIAPAAALSPLVKQQTGNPQPLILPSFSPAHMREGYGAMLHTLGQLWASGAQIDWARFYQHENRRRIALPSYPFDRKRHWVDAPALGSVRPAQKAEVAPASASLPQQPLSPHDMLPRNEIERCIADVWSDVLGQAAIGIDQPFFEIGGDSLAAAQIYARLKQRISVEFSLQQVLAASTIRQFASVLQQCIKAATGAVPPEPAYYCRFEMVLDGERASVWLTEDEFNSIGLPDGAQNLSLLAAT